MAINLCDMVQGKPLQGQGNLHWRPVFLVLLCLSPVLQMRKKMRTQDRMEMKESCS